jgi:hypothetical protein
MNGERAMREAIRARSEIQNPNVHRALLSRTARTNAKGGDRG